MPRVLTLGVALAALGLIAAAPASAAKDRKVVKTRVTITHVSSEIDSSNLGAPYAIYSVYGVVRSPRAECRRDRPKELIHHPSDWHAAGDYAAQFILSWRDRTSPFPQQHDRVIVARWPTRPLPGSDAPDGRFICKGDRSPRFTIPPPSEAGIAATAASAAKARKVVKTRVKITRVSSGIVSPDYGAPYAWYEVKGKVHSPRAECRYGRIVRLNHRTKHPGPHFYTNGRVFYMGWLDRTVPFTQQHDRAKITRSPSASQDGEDGRFICKGDRSPRFTIPPPSEAGIAAAPEGES